MKTYAISKTPNIPKTSSDFMGTVEAENPENALEIWYMQHPRSWGKMDFVNKTIEKLQIYVVEAPDGVGILLCI